MLGGPNEEVGGTDKGARILILGIGNRLLTDDGVGSCFAEVLSTFDLPEGVEVVDGGLGGLSLMDHIEGKEILILVDALDPRDGEPGQVKLFKVNPRAVDPSEAIKMLVEAGSHGVVPELLVAAADAMGYLPAEAYVLGIVPCLIDLGDGITAPAARGCLRALRILRKILSDRGFKLSVEDHRFKERLGEICPEISC